MVRKVSLYKIALKNFTGTNLNVKAKRAKKLKKGKILSRQEKKISKFKMKKKVADSERKMREAQDKLKDTIKKLKKKNQSA
jgi:hypothetical protein